MFNTEISRHLASGNSTHICSYTGMLLVFLAAVLLLSSAQGVPAMPLGLNVAFAFILLWRIAGYQHVSAETCAANFKR